MHPMLNMAIRAARAAGDVIIRHVERVDTLRIERKQRYDFVSEVDRLAEHEIISIAHKAYPDHGILAEESGRQSGNDYLWIIDPLDGTTNFLHGMPHFAVSIAIQHKQHIEHGVIYDPMRQELFTASRGAGAQLNNRRIRVSKLRHLHDALLGTGFPFREGQPLSNYLAVQETFMQRTAGIRRPGAAALDLAYVAAGRFDGFWEANLNLWDIAAGVLLVREAGGLVGSLDGSDDYLESGNVLAANPHIFMEMLNVTRTASWA
ncbi:MAG: inositol monophosphatase [Gammaproteobacteria bacterium]|nr:inositol monophosphatase [Gammaproteobacteria bacterium]